MAIIVLKAWYLESVFSTAQVQGMEPDLRLSRTGLLKTGMRADFLDEVDRVKQSSWFQRYLEGELIEFYIEGSGVYSISNLDLISREMYFNKRNTLVYREPVVFFCGQSLYPNSTELISKVLHQIVEAINRKYEPITPLILEQSIESVEGMPVDAALIRKIKQSVLVIADVSPVSHCVGAGGQRSIPLPSPQVCLELGYALQSKRAEDIIRVHIPRDDQEGRFPFDIENSSYVMAKDAKTLQSQLLNPMVRHLQRSKFIKQV